MKLVKEFNEIFEMLMKHPKMLICQSFGADYKAFEADFRASEALAEIIEANEQDQLVVPKQVSKLLKDLKYLITKRVDLRKT